MNVNTADQHETSFYTIAFTVRSGSSLLCDYLSATGIGLPSEYFQYPFAVANKHWVDEVGASGRDFKYYLKRLIACKAQNGIFGAKLAWDHKNAFLEELGGGCAQDLKSVFKDNKWVYIYRKNNIDQAVSLWRARKTGLWADKGRENSVEPEYDFFGIFTCFFSILTEDFLWRDFFEKNGIKPFIIVYEDFVKDPAAYVSGLFSHIMPGRVLRREDVVLLSELKVQRDGYSKMLKERFREDLYNIGSTSNWAGRDFQLERWLRFFQNEEWMGSHEPT